MLKACSIHFLQNANAIVSSVQFDDLDNYALMGVFDELELVDLLKLIDSNGRFNNLIIDHYANGRFQLDTIQIRYTDEFPGNPIMITDDAINVRDFGAMLKLLRAFGHLIKHIEIEHNHMQATQHQKLGEFLSKYCSQSLEVLKLNYVDNAMVYSLIGPFEKVRVFSLSEGSFDCQSNLNFSKMFPSLQRFEIVKIMMQDSKCTEHKFPHLEYVGLPMYRAQIRDNQQMYEQFFKINPQIRAVSVWYLNNLNAIKHAERYLSHFDELNLYVPSTLIFFDSAAITIRFKHMKKFAVSLFTSASVGPSRIPFQFDHLDEFFFNSFDLSVLWMDFIVQQTSLTKLTMANSILDASQWMQITENLPQLKEIITHWASTPAYFGMLDIFQRHTQLVRVTLTLLSKDEIEELRKDIDQHWQIESIVNNNTYTNFGVDVILIRQR